MNANQQRLSELPPEELDEAIDIATDFADRQMRRCYWKGVYNGAAPGGKLAVDIVQESFADLLEGAKWDDDKPLKLVLKGVVRGKINHLAESWENRTHTSGDDLDPRGEEDQCRFDSIPVEQPTPAEVVAEEEMRENYLLELSEELADEPDLKKVVDAIWEGDLKRSEIGDTVGLTPDEVTNAKKRLKRRLEDFRGKFFQ